MKNNIKMAFSRGFSLVEIAVVVMILSILIASVISGKALIENASIRSFINETTTLRSNVKKFYDIYGFLPGDHPTASISLKSDQINGNGDGKISIFTSGNVKNEVYMLFAHLYASGILKIPYTGLPLGGYSTTQNTALGVNVPESKSYQGLAMYFHSSLRPEMIGNTSIKQPNLLLEISSLSTQTSNGFGSSGGTSPDIAYKIDTKIDDGLPYEGNFFSYTSSTDASLSCISNNQNIYAINARYTSNGSRTCILSFSITEYNYY